MQTGLLSVTFRQLDPGEIIKLASQAGLQAIEWGGDIHVPHGDVERAKQVREWTIAAGIEVASYGSYYRVGSINKNNLTFDQVLASAVALQAPAIRVWAGDQGSESADEAWRSGVAADAARIAGLAQAVGITVDFEYHKGTLTDSSESAIRLLEQIDHPNIRCNWQPLMNLTVEERKQGLRAVLPWLANLHVYQWEPGLRHPLQQGTSEWTEYVAIAREAHGRRHAMLEFVKEDAPQQFLEDAETLKLIIGSGHNGYGA
ncbi:sugar phosphate isomerase/epimerase family protein [Paenibacillus agricola]|uniref:Sugar phosphate isomerase/epimerase n=1 Tax=Paenibacillus agricola TaxID=2716264 RepID=A0ABX0JGW9_9BACL|nr:TIM barrel protein [Paenibacillus agricola]NHN33086.1 sugar phosphate isomerase/epimerase [Paenibacillus agricola]